MDSELLESNVSLKARVDKNTQIRNSTIKERCIVAEFSTIEKSYLDTAVRIERSNYISNSKINRYSYTGMNTVILASEIGSFCSISWGVSIGGANHDYKRITQHSFLYNTIDNIRPYDDETYNRFSEKLIIGNDVWIAANANILRGVSIGDGAVIAANAVITKDVPPYAIVCGIPGKILKYRFEPEIIDLLLQLRWWDWTIEKIRAHYSIISSEPEINTLREHINDLKN